MFRDLRNSFDFFIRNNTQISRKNFIEKDLTKIERNRLENLYINDVLEKSFTPKKYKKIEVLDIGSKNWFYAKAEYIFFKNIAEEFFIDGVEIDAYRLYSNFYSRYEVAKYYTKNLEGMNYIPGNLLDINKKYDYITWFLPFVFEYPHKYWGLPKKYFYPEKLLSHAYSLLKEDGEMLIINQGQDEAIKQKELLDKLGILYKNLGKIKNEYYQYKYERYGYLITKN